MKRGLTLRQHIAQNKTSRAGGEKQIASKSSGDDLPDTFSLSKQAHEPDRAEGEHEKPRDTSQRVGEESSTEHKLLNMSGGGGGRASCCWAEVISMHHPAFDSDDEGNRIQHTHFASSYT